MQQVAREGRAMFDAMAEDEKVEAADEARGMLRPDIIEMLRRRKKPQAGAPKADGRRGGGGVHPSAVAASRGRVAGASPSLSARAESGGSERHVRFAPPSTNSSEPDSAELLRRMALLTNEGQLYALAAEMLPASEREKLAWMDAGAGGDGGASDGADGEASSGAPFGATAAPPLPAPRVNLRGKLIGGAAPSGADGSGSGEGGGDALHHHGAEPERAGYTEGELLTLAGSAVAVQRAIALTAIVPVLRRRHTWARSLGIVDDSDAAPPPPSDAAAKGNILARPAVAVVCAALTASAANAHLTSLCAALGAAHALFFASSASGARQQRQHTALALAATQRGSEQLAPTRHQMRAARDFVRCKGVAALRRALAQLRTARAVDASAYVGLVLDVLLLLASTCRSGAAAIVADDRLTALLVTEFVLTPAVARSPSDAAAVEERGAAAFGAGPAPLAFALVRALCRASHSNVLALEARGVFRCVFAVLGEFSLFTVTILRESCSQFDSPA